MDHTINIIVKGDDRASGPLRSIGGALSNMSQIAGGILGANLFMRIASGIQGIITKSIGATGAMQQMQVGMEGLIARELAQGETVRELTDAQVTLSTAEKLRLKELQASYSSLSGTLADVTAKYNSVAASKGDTSTRALELKLEMENLETQIAQTASNMAYLEDASDGVVTKFVETTQGARDISEVMPEAQKRAAELMDELARIAILSPYQVETIQNTFRTAMAFGYTTDQAKSYTEALLNVAAGTGANNEMMGRMAYNLAQVRMQGRVTSVDIRQLSMAGFDLVGVLRYMGDELGIQIDTHEDFNKALAEGAVNWDQFTELFAKYADENFGGASERMARTLTGLQSTFADVFTLTMPQIMGGAVERFTEFANGILDSFLSIRESPLMDSLAEAVTGVVDRAITAIEPFVKVFQIFFETLGKGIKPAIAFEWALRSVFPPEVVEKILGVIDGFNKFRDTIREIGAALSPFVKAIGDFITQFVSFKDVIIAIGILVGVFLINALLSLAVTLAPFLALIAVIALLRNVWQKNIFGIRDILTKAWNDKVLPALTKLWEWLKVKVPQAIQALSTYWTNTLLPALQTAWGWVQTNVFPILQTLWAWLQVNIPLAIAWLSNFWETVLLPALQNFWGWVQTTVFPILLELWNWLQVNIPAAIAWLSNFWTTVLWPAMLAFWGWITTVAIPKLQEIWNWLQTNIPAAITTLQTFWNNLMIALQPFIDYVNTVIIPALTIIWDFLGNLIAVAVTYLADTWNTVLLPALTLFWEFYTENLAPLFAALLELLGTTLKLALEVLAGIWENVLLPALTKVWEMIRDNVLPIFDAIVAFLRDTFGDQIEDAGGFIEDLTDIFDSLSKKVQDVIGWVQDLTTKIASVKLPEWLQRHSPSPFEQTLSGISAGLREINRQSLPDFSSNLDSLRAPNLAGATPAAAPITVNVNVDKVGSDMDLNNIAYRVAEEISRRQRR